MISLQTNTPSQPPMAANPHSQAKSASPKAEVQAKDSVEVRTHRIDDKNFSWGDLAKGVAGSVIGATIEGVGGTLAGLKDFVPITYAAEKGLWQSKMLGPILKSSLTLPLLVGGCVAPALAAVAGAVYGLFEGFGEGAEKNPLAAGKKALETCEKMHGEFSKDIVQSIRDAAAKTPSKPEDVYEIRPREAAKGLVSSLGSAVVDAVGASGATWRHIPGLWGRASKEIWKSDVAMPLKVGGEFLATAAAVLAVPLAPLGGLVYGLGKGAYNGYKHGLVESAKLAGKDIHDYDKALSNILKD